MTWQDAIQELATLRANPHQGAHLNPPPTRGRCDICGAGIADLVLLWPSTPQSLAALLAPTFTCCSMACAIVAVERAS